MIKKITLIFLLVSNFQLLLNAQIYISTEFDSLIFVGPDNVECDGIGIANKYIEEYSYFEALLNKENESNSKLIEKYKSKKFFKRRNEKKIQKLEKEIEYVKYEIDIIRKFKMFWLDKIIDEDLLRDLHKNLIGEKCIEIETDSAIFSNSEYLVEYNEMQGDMNYHEFIPVEISKSIGPTWVKKKSGKNCLSADPEDCMIWCKVDGTIIKYSFTDIQGVLFNSKICPAGYTISENDNNCIKVRKFKMKGASTHIIKVIDKQNEQPLKLKSWKVVKCN